MVFEFTFNIHAWNLRELIVRNLLGDTIVVNRSCFSGHQMSVGVGLGVLCLRGGGVSTVRSSASWVMVTWHPL